MAKYVFTNSERYAVFTAQGEKCWLCREPVSLSDMHIDHVVPESLTEDELATARAALQLPAGFAVNSFSNWAPAHPKCNQGKGAFVFDFTPNFELALNRIRSKAERAQEIHDEYVTDRKTSLAMSQLLAAIEIGTLKPGQWDRLIAETAAYIEAHREPEAKGKPIHFAPWLEVVADQDGYLMLRGPAGIGMRPKGEHLDPSWDCPRCGPTAWNGTRCVTCGQMDDGD